MFGSVLLMALSSALAEDATDACADALVAVADPGAEGSRGGAQERCVPEVVEGLEVHARLLTCGGRAVAFGLPHARASSRGRALRVALREVVALRAGAVAGDGNGVALSVEEGQRRVVAGASCSTPSYDWYPLGGHVRDPLDLVTARVRLPASTIVVRGRLEAISAAEVLREHLEAFDACDGDGAGGEWTADVSVGPDGRVRTVRGGASTTTDGASACLSDVAADLRFSASGRLIFTVQLDGAIAGR
jgi:hypothetical protein